MILRPLGLFLLAVLATSAPAAQQTRNVVIVTIDGLRWQEVFRGADENLFDRETGGVPDNTVAALRRDYLAATPEERRHRLMPFFWSTVVGQGLAYGNRDRGSPARVTNEAWSSYPGYNEMLSGRPDPAIVDNTPIPNPNVTVLEWLNGRPGFAGRVAGSAAWRRFSSILNVERSGLPLFITPQTSPPGTVSPRIAELERWMADIPPITADEHFDIFVHHAAEEMIDTLKPRVFLFALGEPDEWAHARRYDRYLDSIRRCDRLIQTLWEKLQAMPEYRGTTTLVLTTDHGRGPNSGDWVRHNRATPHSDETWFAVVGPDTPSLGERRDTPLVRQAQIAATIAALLGEDFRAFAPEAAEPIPDVLAPVPAR
ncbi:MAG TPA: alkaline phosphatase family protein [Opitutaceae bacterium]